MGGVIDSIKASLGELTLLKQLPPAMRFRATMVFLAVSEDQTLPSGTNLFVRDEQGDEFGYVLLDGTVTIPKEDGLLVTCSSPELLGEVQMFSPAHTRTATVTTASSVQVLKFGWRKFFEVAESLFSADEMELLRETLSNLAWDHFTN